MKPGCLLLFMSLMLSGQAHAEKQVLSEIKAPDDMENIHIVKLASDVYSTDLVIFVKKQVPLHKHVAHSETIYVLEGKGLLQLGEESFEIVSGDYIRVPKGTPHGVKVFSSIPLKIISVQAPEFFGKDRVTVD